MLLTVGYTTHPAGNSGYSAFQVWTTVNDTLERILKEMVVA
jgi:hypothetical protein